jgi:hypothetical protein
MVISFKSNHRYLMFRPIGETLELEDEGDIAADTRALVARVSAGATLGEDLDDAIPRQRTWSPYRVRVEARQARRLKRLKRFGYPAKLRPRPPAVTPRRSPEICRPRPVSVDQQHDHHYWRYQLRARHLRCSELQARAAWLSWDEYGEQQDAHCYLRLGGGIYRIVRQELSTRHLTVVPMPGSPPLAHAAWLSWDEYCEQAAEQLRVKGESGSIGING